MKCKILILLFIQLFNLNKTFALSEGFAQPAKGLFSSYEIANFKLEAPFTTLFAAKKLNFFEIKKVKVNGVLSYTDENEKLIKLAVELHIKGFTSTQFCTFPKLEIKIPKLESVGTVFEGTKTVDLNTHCVEQDDSSTAAYAQYTKASFNNHREAMIYRIMDIINMPSLRARPVMVQYTDTDEKSKISVKKDFLYQAFFLEDYSDFRKRNNLKAVRGVNDVTKADTSANDVDKINTYIFSNIADSPNIDLDDAARSSVLQFFIGNGDWFIQTTGSDLRIEGHPDGENLWNMKIVQDSKNTWITIPQDFNFSMFMQNYPFVQPINAKVFDLANTNSKINILESFVNKKDQIYEVIKQLDNSEPILKRLDLVYAELNKMLSSLRQIE